jgi:tetratricopeptide (TPR) repeat protein
MADEDLLHPGDCIADHYHVESLLGGGGMGQVFLARDLRLDRRVAIKVMRADLVASADAEARFAREARVLSRLVHPNIVGVHAFGRIPQGHYLVMEFIEGETLEQRLSASGALDLRDTLAIARQLASGLAEAHALGVVHRDIKPGNVLVRRLVSGGWLAKLVDFGLARDIDVDPSQAVTRAAGVLGTPAYMSPEQIEGRAVDGRSDLYSLAVLIFQMLTGHLPYHRTTVQAMLSAHLIDPPPALTQLRSHERWPPAIEREVHRALAKKADDRPATVSEFIDSLERAAQLWLGSSGVGDSECPSCGQSSVGGRYCSGCGTAVPLTHCRTCGHRREGERYTCADCGASLLARRGEVPALSGRDTPVLRVAAVSPSTVAVVVARWQSTTAQLPWAELTEAFLSCVEREGGRPLALVGGEAVALFGIGGLREQDVEAAVDSALALVGAVAALGVAGIDLRIGIEVGRVYSRGVTVAWGTALAAGEAVEAARTAALQAGVGAVCVGPVAFREIRSLYQTAPSSQGVGRVVQRRRIASLALADYVTDGAELALIGRDDELTDLVRAARKVRRQGCLAAVPLLGPAQSGKTRLVQELLRNLEVEDEPWQFDIGRCSATGLPVAYEPFVDILRARLKAHEIDGEAALLERLGRLPGVADSDPQQRSHRVAALGRMLGAGADEAAARPVTQAEQQAAFEAYVAWLRAACAEAPLVLVIEDLQWAKEPTLELLAHLARSCVDDRLLLLLPLRTARADQVLDKLSLPAARLAPLEVLPLEVRDMRQLLAKMRPGADISEPLLQSIVAIADGLPGQVAELVEVMTADGLFVAVDGAWQVQPGALQQVQLERALADAVMRRLGRLAPAERGVIEAIAIAGNYATRGMIEAIVERSIGEAELEAAKQTGLVVESRQQHFKGEREFAVRRRQVADAIEAAWSRELRQAAQRRIARWLLAWQGPRPQGMGALLAHCYMGAGQGDQAAQYLLQTAADSLRALANRDAFEAYGAAVEVARDWHAAGDDPLARQALCDALLGRCEVGLLLGEHATVVQSAEEVAAVAASPAAAAGSPVALQAVRAHVLQGEALRNIGDNDAAVDVLQRATEQARQLDNGGLEALRAQTMLATVWIRRNDYDRAAAVVEACLRDAQLLPTSAEQLACLGRLHTWMGHIHSRNQQLGEARRHYDRAGESFDRGGDRVGVAMAQLSVGNVHYRLGQLDEAHRVYQHVIDLCRPIEYARGIAVAEINVGHVLLDQKKAQAALEVLRSAEHTNRRLNMIDSLPESLRLLAAAQLAMDDALGADRSCRESLALARKMGNAAMAAAAQTLLDQVTEVAQSLSATTMGA